MAQGYFQYLHRPFMQVCSSPECVFFHMKLSELFIFCSFLMKLAGFQTPESQICRGFFSPPQFAYEPFSGSWPKTRTKSPSESGGNSGRLGADADPRRDFFTQRVCGRRIIKSERPTLKKSNIYMKFSCPPSDFSSRL